MYTATEIQLLRNADPGVQIPGIDTPTGNPLPASSLKPLSSITTAYGAAPFYYVPAWNEVVVTTPGTVLSGYDFGSATVDVAADNVTIKDCNFTATSGYFAVLNSNNAANLTVTDSTFDSKQIPSGLCDWIHSNGTVTVTNNSFINTPADGIGVNGGGIISGNYFSGSGYTSNQQHPDAIWITGETAPMTISNNFIDWSTNASSIYSTNDCIRITGEEGPVSNLTVTGNFLLNGTTSIQAVNGGGPGAFSNISITNNYLGFGQCFGFYPGSTNGVTETGNVIFDYKNSAYSTNAWAAYQAAGLPTPTLLTSTNGSTVNAGSSSGPTTLYAGQAATLLGGGHESNFVGGFGTQYIWSGPGASIFTYLSPADLRPRPRTASATSIRPRTSSISATWTRTSFRAASRTSPSSARQRPPARARRSDIIGTRPTIKRSSQATLAGDTTPDF